MRAVKTLLLNWLRYMSIKDADDDCIHTGNKDTASVNSSMYSTSRAQIVCL